MGEAASRRFESAQVGEAASRRFNVTLTVGTPYHRPALPASLSGITWAGGMRYYAVSDDVFTDEVGLYPLTVELSSNGLSVVSCKIPSPANRIQLADAYDLEDVAFDSANGTVWAADETRGVESLTLSENGKTLWLCTEEALPYDGPRSSPTTGTTVRLLKYTRATVTDNFTLAGTYFYTTDAWSQAHDFKGKGRRGVSGLCVLPDGSLLVLERELSFGGSHALTAAATARLSFAIYHVDVGRGALVAPTCKKIKLASGGGSVFTSGNFEGICLGPSLPNGQRSVLLISDAGDGVSPPQILPMVLSFSDQQQGENP